MKRVSWLQNFFTELQRYKTFRSSEIFQAFISTSDEKKFEAMKKQIKKMPAPKSLADLRLLGGKFNCDMEIRKMQLSNNIAQYVKQTQPLYKELADAICATTSTMLLLSDAFAKNAEIVKDLIFVHANIEVFLPLTNQCTEIADLFASIKETFSGMSELYAKQSTLMKDRFGHFFEFYHSELESLRTVTYI